MGKKPKSIYKPGELDSVRQKLGELTEDEARRMSKVLGGEVGYEKSEHEIQKERESRQTKERRVQRSEIGRNIPDRNQLRRQREKKESRKTAAKSSSKKEKPKQFSFLDKVRINFLCKKPEYRLKTLGGAIGTVFTILFPLQDNINPKFLKNLDLYVLKPISNLVRSTRALYTKTKPDIYEEISGHKLYRNIIKVIKDWDIDGLDGEVFHFKKRFQHQKFTSLLRLCKLIYFPIMRLSALDLRKHIIPAFQFAYAVNMKTAEESPGYKPRIISLFYEIEKNLPIVFNEVKKQFYPFLLKYISNTFYIYEEFFVKEYDKVLDFLSLREEDLISAIEAGDHLSRFPKEEKLEEVNEESPKDKEKSSPGAADEEQNQKEEENPEENTPSSVYNGLNYLEKLYPNAHWYRLDEFPDFYPYFQPIFNYPSGFELIPRTDPLQQVVILLSILNDLFYGFRHIKLGLLRDPQKGMDAYNIQGKVDQLISCWPLYVDEIIGQVYVSRLIDYCRQIEKDRSFKRSDIAKKVVTEMDWIKKNYLIPYYSMKMHSGVAGLVKRKLPKLFELTTELKDILSQVVLELKQKSKEKGEAHYDSVQNPWAKYQFDLENNTSKRLNKLLTQKELTPDRRTKIVDKRNNANLIFYTTAILNILDYFLNEKKSHLYNAPEGKIFRSVNETSDVPQYTVDKVDPFSMMEKEQTSETGQPEPDKSVKPEKPSLEKIISQKVKQLEDKKLTFSIVYLKVEQKDDSTPPEDAKKILSESLDNGIIFNETADEFILIIENPELKKSLAFIKNLHKKMEHFKITVGALQYQLNWKFGYFSKVLDKMKHFARETSKLIYLDSESNKFRSVNLS